MKYYKSSTQRFPKLIGSTGFITIIACCLIAIGAAAWFAVSRYDSADQGNGPASVNEGSQSYSQDDGTYNNSTAQTPEVSQSPEATDVTESVEDIPYDDKQSVNESAVERSFILPVEGNISKGYSDTALQYSQTYGDMRLHTGVDILCESGTEIKAAGSGKVVSVIEDSQYGRSITIDHGDGIVVKYCGLASVNTVEGESVSVGTVIGTLGEVPCECMDESHLHLEATLNGEIASPLTALKIN